MHLTEAQKDAYIKQLEERQEEAQRRITLLQSRCGALMVDADQREQRAMRRADDCAEHGRDIVELDEQVRHFVARSDEFKEQRNILLGLLWSLRDFADGDKETATLKRDNVREVVRRVEREYQSASKKFDKRWAEIREETEHKRRELFEAGNGTE